MRYLLVGMFTLVMAFSAHAESVRRGLVTTVSCPYSCREAGVPAADCLERQRGDLCEVEDLREAPGHRSLFRVRGKVPPAVPAAAAVQPAQNTRGLVTTTSCPYDCGAAGIPRESCREWNDGDKCHVEDLRQAPGHRTMMRGR